ncbi:hypothetical protein BDZ97DRAFT_1926376 [Flammula alnicola]|nr:hypothetical protein BDZ97DRAFT_1926376 [Flammula alnicola]
MLTKTQFEGTPQAVIIQGSSTFGLIHKKWMELHYVHLDLFLISSRSPSQFIKLSSICMFHVSDMNYHIQINLEEFKDTIGVPQVEMQIFILDNVQYAHNTHFDPVLWFLAWLFYRCAFVRNYVSMSDLLADLLSELVILADKMAEPLTSFTAEAAFARATSDTLATWAKASGLPAYSLLMGLQFAKDIYNHHSVNDSVLHRHYSHNTNNMFVVGLHTGEIKGMKESRPDEVLETNLHTKMSLPLKIERFIFNIIDDWKDLQAICLSSKLFNSIIQPTLFKKFATHPTLQWSKMEAIRLYVDAAWANLTPGMVDALEPLFIQSPCLVSATLLHKDLQDFPSFLISSLHHLILNDLSISFTDLPGYEHWLRLNTFTSYRQWEQSLSAICRYDISSLTHLYIWWGLPSIDSYVNIGQVLQKAPNLAMLTMEFEWYEDHEMLVKGLQRFMSQLRSNPNWSCALSLAWRFNQSFQSHSLYYDQVDLIVSIMGSISGIDNISGIDDVAFEISLDGDLGLRVLEHACMVLMEQGTVSCIRVDKYDGTNDFLARFLTHHVTFMFKEKIQEDQSAKFTRTHVHKYIRVGKLVEGSENEEISLGRLATNSYIGTCS